MSVVAKNMGLQEILTMQDIARYLRISRSAAYELAHKQGFPALVLGRKIRVRRESFLSWLDEKENGTASAN